MRETDLQYTLHKIWSDPKEHHIAWVISMNYQDNHILKLNLLKGTHTLICTYKGIDAEYMDFSAQMKSVYLSSYTKIYDLPLVNTEAAGLKAPFYQVSDSITQDGQLIVNFNKSSV